MFEPTHVMSMDELVTRANAVVAELGLNEIADSRVAATITDRTIRYYVNIGVVHPPIRNGVRALWTETHIDDLIRIRRAQAHGKSLSQIPRLRPVDERQTWITANLSRHLRTDEFAQQSSDTGWCVGVAEGVTLAGTSGHAPTSEQIEQIRQLLETSSNMKGDLQ